MTQYVIFAYISRSKRPNVFDLLKGPVHVPRYLVLKFGNILPINNCDMAQNVILKRA